MLIPLRDDNVTRRPPSATTGIIGLCTAVFLYQISLPGRGSEIVALGYGMIPSVLFGTHHLSPAIPTVAPWLTVFTSMFLHGGFLHIAGNMLYLWVFGRAVDDALGSIRFVVFYLICGVAAAMTQAFVEPDATVPMIGASGAISGILGAYLVLFPRARVLVLFFWGLITPLHLPAKVLLLWWIVVQVASILLSSRGEGGVAWYAHIGGFVAGMILIYLFRPRRFPPAQSPPLPPSQFPRRWNSPSPWGRRGPWG
ncbi:MAG TPA: rhomboid family intramembrane serine protease [Alphaproteobacteria bacterium]